MKCRYLAGENVVPRYTDDAKALIGKRVEFLRGMDIDKSGRGYFFPRTGTVEQAKNRNIVIDGEWIMLSTLVEMRVIE